MLSRSKRSLCLNNLKESVRLSLPRRLTGWFQTKYVPAVGATGEDSQAGERKRHVQDLIPILWIMISQCHLHSVYQLCPVQ